MAQNSPRASYSHQHLLVGENKVQHSTSPHGLLYHLEKEVITNAVQNPPGSLMPCCVVYGRGGHMEVMSLHRAHLYAEVIRT